MTKETDYSQFSLLDLFSMEVKTQVAVLNDRLLALETQPQTQEDLAALMRAAHSIKGAARIVQLNSVVTLAHAMEDCFVAAQAGEIRLTAADIDVLLAAVDMLLNIGIACEGNSQPQLPEEANIQTLVSAIANILNSPPVSQTAPVELAQPQTAILESNSTASAWVVPPSQVFSAVDKPETLQNRVVRVGADNLNCLMGLAGESLVEAKWLETFADSLLKLKSRQTELFSLLEKLQELLGNNSLNLIERQIQEQMSAVSQTASECRQLLGDRHNELELFCQRSSNLADRLYRQVIATHMSPFGEAGQGFPRMVRDMARQLGKRIKLEIFGKSTLVDRDILERLEAPLTHILRNAIDHGIETPAERLALGKPETGTIRLEVVHRAGMLLITVSDDGRGIDLEFLRLEIVTKNLTTPEMAAKLTEAELMEFLFLPGFSTAKTVTEISGRGVGLDVAHSTVREVGGTLRAVSQPGLGMTLYLQLPLTLSVLRTLVVEIAHEAYAFGLARIDQVVMIPRTAIVVSENQPFIMVNDQAVALISAHQVLELPASVVNPEFLPVVIISDRLSRYGVVVDRFIGECNLVVRPLDSRLGKVPNISAAALLDDGSPVLIIDIEDLVRSISKVLASGQLSQVNHATQTAVTKTYKRVLVVDDSITVREMERKLLENKGYKVEVAVNGMDGWNAIRSSDYNLVITDIDMPRMNGFELTSQIKTHDKLKHIPVIIVSYKDREEDRIHGLEAGANYYLTKSSFHDDTLLTAVIDLIGES
ncbi:hybrid sensor histidine kinase/response regulator [Anabaena sp. CA = ATCC 33047]|uniref:hybrid sensor histidine kinase/response regulator n=1 Tax=Anabaena sp. (strain CA / ATCC 33047) TaxID=52271 RepID=UPI00082F92D9|nr:hybrid sensor histidine kinase/response regulator [Anabaena sp. CA = ATCC 33047]